MLNILPHSLPLPLPLPLPPSPSLRSGGGSGDEYRYGSRGESDYFGPADKAMEQCVNYALRIRQSDECIDLLIKLKQFTHAANVAIGKGDTDALERIMEVAPVG